MIQGILLITGKLGVQITMCTHSFALSGWKNVREAEHRRAPYCHDDAFYHLGISI
jgi:hypothetical protein